MTATEPSELEPGELEPGEVKPGELKPRGRCAAEPDSSTAHLLPVMMALVERQRHYTAEVLHDGPMQEFTAVLLALGQLRKGLNAEYTARLMELETKLRDTVTALRPAASLWLSDLTPAALLDAVLRNWVDGPLAEAVDLTVDGADDCPALDRQEIAAVVGLVQLVLHELDPTARVQSASVGVSCLPAAVDIRVSAVPATRLDADEIDDHETDGSGTGGTETEEADGDLPDDDLPDDDEADARAVRLHLLATALRADANYDGDGTWTFRLLLPR